MDQDLVGNVFIETADTIEHRLIHSGIPGSIIEYIEDASGMERSRKSRQGCFAPYCIRVLTALQIRSTFGNTWSSMLRA
jgi:hypothetical protein